MNKSNLGSSGELAPIGFPLEAIALFISIVTVSVWLDLFAHRKTHDIEVRDAAIWSAFWIMLAMGWYGFLYFNYASEYADLFLAGYALEKSLSIDNLMVFIAIFSSFTIVGSNQHRVLYYGILGAVVLRFLFIALGTSLLLIGPWMLMLFAVFVLWSAFKMWKESGNDEEIEDYSNHWSVTAARRWFPIFPRMAESRFFLSRQEVAERVAADPSIQIQGKGRYYATPMFLCLAVIEASDIMFSFDSVPAVIAVTQQPLLIYSSIIFAILGLRSLYFVLAALQKFLHYLDKAVIVLLVYIGLKLGVEALPDALRSIGSVAGVNSHHGLMTVPSVHIGPSTNVLIVLGTLLIGILASFIFPKKES